MALPPVSTDDLQAAVFAYKQAGWNKAEAARRLGLPGNTLKDRLTIAKKRGISPIGGWPDAPASTGDDKPACVAERGQPLGNKDGLRVFVIGDAHDSPKLHDKTRFFHLGCAARNWGADRIVWIGDVLDMESLCGHVGDDTLRGRVKPTFLRDIDSGSQALSEFRRGLQRHVDQDCVEGNHEGARVDRWENDNPNAQGLYRAELDRLWQSNGITNHRFGAPLFVGGVCFVHIPLNGMGKPYGGKTANSQIARDSLHDVVRGHTHRAGVHTEPKLFNKQVRVFDAGTCLPDGYVADYAKHQTTCWWHGALCLTIDDGHVTGWDYKPMTDIARAI